MPRVILCLLMLAHGTVLAQPAPPDAETVYFPCISCHGENGEGSPAINAPAIGGQSYAYLERQLQNFRSGVRGQHPQDPWGAQMALMAANLKDGDVKVLADLISRMPVFSRKSSTAAVPESYSTCAACHGDDGQGIDALNAPRIADLDEAYVIRQLRYFRDGIRGSLANDPSGAVMRNALPEGFDDAVIKELSDYIQTL